jgi:molecular chaperone HtpG
VTHEGTERIDAPPPWRDERLGGAARREAIMAYGREAFGKEFLDFIELQSAAGDVDGVAYVLHTASATGIRRADRVYLKGMLLSDRAENLLPDWAFFVRAIVDVRSLRPLASREAFFEDETLAAARESLGACIKDYLRRMAREDPDRLGMLLSLHHRPIKQLAAEDAEFLMLVAPWLPFETSGGWMPLEQYLTGQSSIVFAPTVDAFRQIAPLVRAQGRSVINAGYANDRPILERFAEISEIEAEVLDAQGLVEGFAELGLDEREEMFELLRTADVVLSRFKCSAQAKHFAPAALPALFSAGETASFVRAIDQTKEKSDALWGAVLDDLSKVRGTPDYARFTFNFDNPMVRRLARVDDRELMRRLIEVLYVQTLLLGHHPLNAAEMSLVSESLTGLIEWSLELGSAGRMLQ